MLRLAAGGAGVVYEARGSGQRAEGGRGGFWTRRPCGPGGGGDVLEVVGAVGLGRLAWVVGGGAGRVPVRPGMRAWFLGWLEQQFLVF